MLVLLNLQRVYDYKLTIFSVFFSIILRSREYEVIQKYEVYALFYLKIKSFTLVIKFDCCIGFLMKISTNNWHLCYFYIREMILDFLSFFFILNAN